jgi:hypothetical protein
VQHETARQLLRMKYGCYMQTSDLGTCCSTYRTRQLLRQPYPLAAPPPRHGMHVGQHVSTTSDRYWGTARIWHLQPQTIAATAHQAAWTPPPSSFTPHQLHPLSLAVQHPHGSSTSMPDLSNCYGAALVLLCPAEFPIPFLPPRRHCQQAPVLDCKVLDRTPACHTPAARHPADFIR